MGGGGVKNGQKSVHMVYEWPLMHPLYNFTKIFLKHSLNSSLKSKAQIEDILVEDRNFFEWWNWNITRKYHWSKLSSFIYLRLIRLRRKVIYLGIGSALFESNPSFYKTTLRL